MLKRRHQVLKLDWDAERGPLTRRTVAWRLGRAGYRVVTFAERPSPSGTGRHVLLRVTPPPRSALEVVALQLLLASDPLREACNLRRARLLDRGAMPAWAAEGFNVLYQKVG